MTHIPMSAAGCLSITGSGRGCAYYSFAVEKHAFYRLPLSLSFVSPTCSQSAILSQPFNSEHFRLAEGFFIISKTHHNLRGGEQLLTASFFTVIKATSVYGFVDWHH